MKKIEGQMADVLKEIISGGDPVVEIEMDRAGFRGISQYTKLLVYTV